MTELATRGTANGNRRGSTTDRAARRAYLVITYRADVDVPDFHGLQLPIDGVPFGMGEAACRCYRCGVLLTVDRIIPGCQGGTYRRSNIRPACARCNSSTGGKLARQR